MFVSLVSDVLNLVILNVKLALKFIRSDVESCQIFKTVLFLLLQCFLLELLQLKLKFSFVVAGLGLIDLDLASKFKDLLFFVYVYHNRFN